MSAPLKQLEVNPRGIPRAPFVVSMACPPCILPRLHALTPGQCRGIRREQGRRGRGHCQGVPRDVLVRIHGLVRLGTFNDGPLINRKYRYMELSLQQRRKALLGKIPDMENTLRVVEFLHRRRQKKLGMLKAEEDEEEDEDGDLNADEGDADDKLTSLFELNDTLYAEAQVEETGEVGIWLGVSRSAARAEKSWYLPDPY